MDNYNNHALLQGGIDILATSFRRVFKSRWKELTTQDWLDCEAGNYFVFLLSRFITYIIDALKLGAQFKQLKEKLHKTQQKVFAKGNTNTWDISLLSLVLTVWPSVLQFGLTLLFFIRNS